MVDVYKFHPLFYCAQIPTNYGVYNFEHKKKRRPIFLNTDIKIQVSSYHSLHVYDSEHLRAA